MNKDLIKIIKTMSKIDQQARFNSDDKFIVYAIDLAHESKLRHLVEKYGYPTSKTVGKNILKDFWLLVQHVPFDIEFQERCLNNCDFEPSEYAHLYDRIQINKGLDQKYGTQLNKPILNLKETNKNRLEVGLVRIEEWIKNFNTEENTKIQLEKKSDGSAEYIR